MTPWNRKNRPKLVPPPVEPLMLRALIWLLVTLALAVAPHTGELPIWLTGPPTVRMARPEAIRTWRRTASAWGGR